MKLSQEMIKQINKNEHYTEENFIEDCKTYIKAVKSGRLRYRVSHVSKSGMSRDIVIESYEGTMSKGYYRTYTNMLEVLGYRLTSPYGSDIKVSGAGMDMLFDTNYNIIHTFKSMGLITAKTCVVLAQRI